MKSILFFCLIAVSALVATGQVPPKWIDYKSAEGNYTVSLPEQPKLSKQVATDPNGKPFDQHLATTEGSDATIIIGYFDYQGSTFSLDRARDGVVRSVKGKLVSEAEIKLGSFPGRNMIVEAELDGFSIRAYVRFFDAGQRVYMLQYLVIQSDDGPQQKTSIAKLFDSFKVLPRP